MKVIKLNSELHINTESDAAYLYLNSKKESKVNYTSFLLEEDGSNINGKMIGIEFLPASKFFK